MLHFRSEVCQRAGQPTGGLFPKTTESKRNAFTPERETQIINSLANVPDATRPELWRVSEARGIFDNDP